MCLSINDFQIKLERLQADNSLKVEIAAFPEATPLCESCRVPFELDILRQECLWPLLSHIERPLEPARLEQIGKRLAAVLLPPPVSSALFGALLRSSHRSIELRLHLIAHDRAIAELPWEFAFLGACPPLWELPGFLGLLPRVHLIRQNGGGKMLEPLALDKLKVLVAWASPSGIAYPALAFARKEAKALVSTLTDAPYCRRLDVRELANATIEDLHSVMESFRPHVLHFIGHGEDGGADPAIILECGRGHARLGSKQFASMLNYGEFRLISLSACRTAAIAQQLTFKGIPAAIAMQLPWTDTIATLFTQALFGALTISAPLDEALAQARQCIKNAGPDWGNPVLYLCGRNTALIEMKPLRPAENLPFPRNPHFVGREEAINEIDTLLNDERSQHVAIVGMSGMGKTQLALEYAHRRLNEYPGGVFWIRAADERQMRDSFDALGSLFNVPEGIEGRSERVLKCIKDSPVRSLIVFDNLTTCVVANWIPGGDLNHVLATTRDVDSVRAMYSTLVLSEFDESSGTELLLARRSSVSDAERIAAVEVVKKTGALPLALALLSFYADRMNLTYRECADLLNAAPLTMLSNARKRFTNLTGHDGSLFDTINLSYSRLDRMAKKVLNTACFFSPRGIGRGVLREAGGISSLVPFREALADIESYCLANRDSADRYNVHELTAEYARFRMGAKRRKGCCAAVAQTLIYGLRAANSRMDWRFVRTDIHHCAAAARMCGLEKLWLLKYELVYETGLYIKEHYEFDEAIRYFESAVEAARAAFGTDSLQEARAAMSTATTKAQQGDIHSALDLGNAALNMARAALPAGSPDLADYYNDIGLVVKLGGDPDRAIGIFRAAVDLCIDHNCATFASINSNLGAAHEACKRYSSAIKSYREAMRIDIELFGAEHPRVAITLNNIGRLLTILGKPSEALALHENVLSMYVSTYGRLHPGAPAPLSDSSN